jgi:hypothetical protein
MIRSDHVRVEKLASNDLMQTWKYLRSLEQKEENHIAVV